MLQRHSILLVDDDPRSVTTLAAVLDPLGHRLVHAYDGATALRLFEVERPDLVVCDLVMDGVDGLEVLRRIRAHPDRGHTPVVLITAFTEREPRLAALELGVDEFLEKPLDSAMMRARIGTLLRLQSSRDDLLQRHAALERAQREQGEILDVLVTDVAATIERLHATLEWLDAYGESGAAIARQAVAHVGASLRRMTGIVHDLSWVSWLDASVFPVRLDALAVGALVQQVSAGFEAVAGRLHVDLETSVVQEVVVRADRRLLRRVVENLLDNAMRHATKGSTVLVAVEPTGSGCDLRVCNAGPPIPVDERARIFDKLAGSRTEPGHPGLGLYFCRRALEAQGATIAVVDEPDWPVTFVVRFSLAGG